MEAERMADYTTLMYVRDEGQICETEEGDRVFVMERDEREHLDRHDDGYPISRATLEHCAGWGVEAVHIYAEEDEGLVCYTFDIEEYYDAGFKPVFDEEFATVPRDDEWMAA